MGGGLLLREQQYVTLHYVIYAQLYVVNGVRYT
jgi:hypothetical protein